MRARTLLIAGLVALTFVPDAAQAQFSLRGLLGGITRPFRQVLGGIGRVPHRGRAPSTRTAAVGAGAAGVATGAVAAGTLLGSAGPHTWPNAYEQTIGYALWPNDYAQGFRANGFDVIADTITGQGEPRPAARTATTVTTQNDANSAPACNDNNVQSTWPSERISQTTQLTNAQSEAAQKLQTSVSQSAKNLNCSDQAAQTAPERVQALIRELWAVRDSAIAARDPLKDFYGTLTDAQKVSYKVQEAPQQTQPAQQPQTTGAGAEGRNVDPAAQRAVQVCAQQNAEAAERMTKMLEMRARPNREQQASLENLHKVSADMAKLLTAACMEPVPADPLARLDAANDRLTTINYAATSVQVAFGDFYGRLNDAQKTRLDNPSR